MQLKKLLTGAAASFLLVSNVLANSYGVPERPTNISPSDAELVANLTPTLTTSDFLVKDDAGAGVANTVLTESEWLVYQNTGVTLVGGTNLTGINRDYGSTVYFDVSSSNLTLSGSAVSYAYVNHKRLELTDAAHSLLGYVELPSFIWQSENKDKYLAARFQQFDNAVVVEWNYGDDAAPTPWQLKLQAVLNDDVMGLKMNQGDFSGDFVAAYGAQAVNLCDESNCFSHTFSNIFNSGNAITCSLNAVESSCENASLHSEAPLDDMNISEVVYGVSANTNYLLPSSLTSISEYYWVSRQKGKVNDGPEISGGWSNATKFTTPAAPIVDAANFSVEVVAPESVFYGQKIEVLYRLNNGTGSAIQGVEFSVLSHSLISENDNFELPQGCQLSEIYRIDCNFNMDKDEVRDVSILVDIDANLESTQYIVVPAIQGQAIIDNDWSLNPSTPDFSFELTRLSENVANTLQQFKLKVKNHTAENLFGIELKGSTPGASTEIEGEGCFLQANLYNLVCILGDFVGEEEKEIVFDMQLNNSSEQEVSLNLSLYLCQGDYSLCWPSIKTEELIVVIAAMEPEVTEPEVTEPEVTEPEITEGEGTDPKSSDPQTVSDEGGAGALWLTSLLAIFMRRKNRFK